MTHHHFTYGELLQFGWEKTKQHMWFLIGIMFFYLVITIITHNLPALRDIVSMIMGIALIALSFSIVDGHTPHYRDLLTPFRDYKVTLHYFLAVILSILIIMGGLILLILPGIYLAIRIQFAPYLIVEHKNMGPIEAIKKSMDMTKGIFWKLFGFALIFVFINLLGLLFFGVGLVITLPVTGIAYTYLYRKLSGHAPVHHEPTHHKEAPAA